MPIWQLLDAFLSDIIHLLTFSIIVLLQFIENLSILMVDSWPHFSLRSPGYWIFKKLLIPQFIESGYLLAIQEYIKIFKKSVLWSYSYKVLLSVIPIKSTETCTVSRSPNHFSVVTWPSLYFTAYSVFQRTALYRIVCKVFILWDIDIWTFLGFSDP